MPGCTHCDIRTSALVHINALLTLKKERVGGDQLATPLPFQDFMEMSVTSEGSQSIQQRAARHAAPQNILEGEKYHVGTNNIPKRRAKRAALFMSAPPTVEIHGSTKSTLLCAVYDLSLFVSELCGSLCL